MITIRAGKAAISVCLLLLAGCSREQQDWRSAEAADSIESYDQFIQRHPESELVAQARTRVVQLGEDRDWAQAGSADTADAYRDFVTRHPNGKWAQEARIRIGNFALGEQGGVRASGNAGGGGSGDSGSSGGHRDGLATPGEAAVPAGRRGAAAGSASSGSASAGGPSATTGSGTTGAAPPHGTAPSGGYGVQLGAFGSEAAANAEWRVLMGRFGTELQGLSEHVVMAQTASGRIYRLQTVVGPESRARAICESLRKSSQACVAVLPH